MPGVVLEHASPVNALTYFSQDLNLESIATSTLTASGSISTTQTQSASQPQESSPTAIHMSTTMPQAQSSAFVALSSFGNGGSSGPATISLSSFPNIPEDAEAVEAVAYPVSNLIAVPTQSHASAAITQDASSPSMHPGPKTAKRARTMLQPSTLTNDLNQTVPNSETVLAKSSSILKPPPISDINSGLVPSTQIEKAGSNPDHILSTSRIPIPTLSVTLDSKISLIVPLLQTGNNHTLFVSDSSPSLSPHATIMSSTYMNPPLVTTSVQTTTANSLDHFPLGNQTLTSSGTITVSGTQIFLAQNRSDRIVGTSTELFRPSMTAKISSISNGTDTQIFRGHAVGGRDGLLGSSVLLLVGLAVLLRL